MKSARSLIKLTGSLLSLDETVRMVCPYCNATHEQSLAITNKGQHILYTCPRVSCKTSGKIPLTPYKGIDKPMARVRKRFRGVLQPLTVRQERLLATRYGVSTRKVLSRLRYAPERHMLHVELTDPETTSVIGESLKRLPDDFVTEDTWVLRRLCADHDKPKPAQKTLTYKHTEGPVYLFELRHKGEPVIVVEDALSALHLSSLGYNSFALLGTHMSTQHIELLREYTTTIVLALDPDALTTAHKLRRNIQLFFKDVLVVALSADPKDMRGDELRTGIRETLTAGKEVVNGS